MLEPIDDFPRLAENAVHRRDLGVLAALRRPAFRPRAPRQRGLAPDGAR